MDYKGIKIYDKVIIVERTSIEEGGYNWRGRTVNQGYVVDAGNQKMLDTALNWAKWSKYDESIRQEYNDYWKNCNKTKEEKAIADKIWQRYRDSEQPVEGIVHEYENGSFEITLDEAAEGSSQGGKLSFWNCIIKAPDGKTFLVGINAELLLHLMMSTTLIKGTCQEKVWLGRIKGTQVGVFTPEMEDFKQAKLDEEARNAKKTNKYVVGDIVETLTSKDLYVGEFYVYASKFVTGTSGWYNRHYSTIVYEKPKKVHGFVSLWRDEGIKFSSDSIDLKATKPAKIVTGHNEEVALKYRAMVKNFPSEYKKLRVEHKDHYDDPQPFTYFNENLSVRLSDKVSSEEIKADMLLALEYQKENNKKSSYTFEEDIKLQKDLKPGAFETYTEDRYYSYTYFYNYMEYYKK